MQKLGERFEALRLVTRIFGISSSTQNHSLYVHNNLYDRQTDVRKLNGFTDSHVKLSLCLNKNRISNFDGRTVHVVQFIILTNKCTTYIYTHIYIFMCVYIRYVKFSVYIYIYTYTQ